MPTIIEALQRGLSLQNAGQLDDASRIYRSVLNVDPEQPDALHLLGLVEMSRQNYPTAIALIEKAVGRMPECTTFLGNLGVVYRFANRYEDAIRAYQRALGYDPKNSDIQFNLGKSLKLVGRLDDAEVAFRRSIELSPKKPSPWLSLLSLNVDRKDLQGALQIGMQAIGLFPDHAELRLSLGAVYKKLGLVDAAVSEYRKAAAIAPTHVDALCRLAATLITRQQIDEGRAWLDRAMAIEPKGIYTLNCLGLLHNTLGNSTDAIKVYREAVDIHPTYATAFANYGSALKKLGALSEALEKTLRSQELEPTNFESLVVEAGIRLSLGQITEAKACFLRAVEHRGGYRDAHDGYLMALHYDTTSTPESILTEHLAWNDKYVDPKAAQGARREKDRAKPRLKVGFVSADLGAHPVGYFTAPLLQHLDRERFETFVYSDRIGRDWLASDIEQNVAHWMDTGSWSDETLAARMREDELDIAFDQAGHTAYNRLMVFSKRVAPVQISWAGYVGTTGVREMDYVLGDPYHTPTGCEAYYSERILRMPHDYVCYCPPKVCEEVKPLPALARGYVNFGAMCNPAKVNPDILAIWGQVLASVPNSRLLLSYCGWPDAFNQKRVREALSSVGCEDRVDFSQQPSATELMRVYHDIDIALDTFPYSGGLTTIESMWMGVPTITYPGKWFAGRHSHSHLNNAGLGDWSVPDKTAYVQRAVEAVSNLSVLAELRRELRDQVRASPLGDGAKFARDFAAMLNDVWAS